MSANPLKDAVDLYQAGRLRDAQKLAQRCVKQAPDHPEARRLLAMILADRGDTTAALEQIRRVVEKQPLHLPAVATLADLQQRAGKPGDAERTLRGAIALNAGVALLHSNLGTVLMQLGRIDEAIESYRTALRLQPDFTDAQLNIGRALFQVGDLDGAASHLTRYLTSAPDDADSQYMLGSIRLAQRHPSAAQHLAIAINLAPDETRYRLVQVRALAGLANDGDLAQLADLEPVLLERYADADVDPSPLIEPTAALLATDSAFPLLTSNGYAGGLTLAKLPGHLTGLVQPLFLAALIGGVVLGRPLEDLLRDLRLALLDAATDGNLAALPATVDELLVALATQAWLNEYVWSADDRELASVDTLSDEPRSVLVAACYRPLTPSSRAVLASLPQTSSLLEEQLDAADERRSIAAVMPTLTEIDDEISLKVQAQYEANPYPRLQRANRLTPRSLQDELASVLPLTSRDRLPDTAAPNILIAGCGTGQHVVETTTRYSGAEVLAVDLSAASLAFAKQRAQRMGLTVEFLQADILDLGALDRRFDLIESAGVLHHMADPEAGWRVLTDLLVDDGVMRIALYSELARASVVAAHALFDELPQTADEIRSARDRLRALPPEHPASAVVESRDFYSLSTCRDMLFHAQEHRFTVPQLAAIMDRLGLEFLGFELPPGIGAVYRQRYPDDPAMRSLNDWDAFEQDNPGTFGDLYQFLVRRC